MTAKIAVLVSGGGTNLQALINAQGTVIKSGRIELVISNNPDAYALVRAEKAGIRTAVVKKSEPDFEDRITALCKANGIDLIVLAGFMCILSKEFTTRFAGKIINIHPSLIPSFCGAGFYGLHVHEAALAYGVKVTGATVHIVNEIPDGGKILIQKAVDILPDDTPETLQKRVMEQAEWKILPEAAEMMCAEIIKE